ncbi:MAG: hypothetical protein QOH13_1629 [Thermoleophilaceae bacterium]|nr:hypothetical protein [Thermoleophilaceae bacterium]
MQPGPVAASCQEDQRHAANSTAPRELTVYRAYFAVLTS